jgi:hypothetical protein
MVEGFSNQWMFDTILILEVGCRLLVVTRGDWRESLKKEIRRDSTTKYFPLSLLFDPLYFLIRAAVTYCHVSPPYH